jgi:hypothetical protein
MPQVRKRPGNYRRPDSESAPGQLQTIKSGLLIYKSISELDGRTWVARRLKKVRKGLLEGFPYPAPYRVQILADLCAIKIVRINIYQANVLSGVIESMDSSENLCLSMMNSATRDLEALDRLARQYAPTERTPTLQEYLKTLQEGRLIEVEGGNGE